MKILNKLLLIPFLGILFFGCSKGDEVEQEQSLIGSWQLMQKTEKDVTYGRDWVNVKDGYTYTFSSDGKFLSTRFADCTDGTYKIDSNQVIWDYGCDGFTTDIENEEGLIVEVFGFEPKTKTVVFIQSNQTCSQTCLFRFRKIGD